MNCPHWLLALTIPFSRSDRARTSTAGVDAGCAEGLLRTMPASLLQLPEGLGGPFRRECQYSRRVTERQRVRAPKSIRAVTRVPALSTDRSGTPAVPDGCPLERSGSLRRNGPSSTPIGWHAGSYLAFRMPPGARRSTGFPPPVCRQTRHSGRRALPADALDLPHVTTVRWLHDAPALLHGRDRAVTRR
jgi:hypothetical protein